MVKKRIKIKKHRKRRNTDTKLVFLFWYKNFYYFDWWFDGRIVPGQYLAIDPKGRAVMIGAVEKQKLVFIMNRSDSLSELDG